MSFNGIRRSKILTKISEFCSNPLHTGKICIADFIQKLTTAFFQEYNYEFQISVKVWIQIRP